LIELLNQIFNVKDTEIVNTRINKKLFNEYSELTKTELRAIKEEIESIYSLYKINKSKSHIETYITQDYKYEEIPFLYVNIRNKEKYQKISEILHKAIINPVFIIIENQENLIFSIAHKRINLADKSKRVIEKTVNTDWIDINENNFSTNTYLKALDLTKRNRENLFELYNDLIRITINFNAIKIDKNINIEDKEQSYKSEQMLSEIGEINKEISRLRKDINKKDKSFSEKVEINIKIKKLEGKLEELLNV